MHIVDTHLHLQEKYLLNNIDIILKRSFESNVRELVCMSVDYNSALVNLKLSKKYNFIHTAIGLHPLDIKNNEYEKIEKLIKENHTKIKAIGEIGLDLHYEDNIDINIQIDIFKKQLDLAAKYNLPVSIHIRDAYNYFIEAFKPYKNKVRGVFHCFTLDYTKAKEIINLGLYLGIGGIITYKSAKDLNSAILKLSLDNIVLETDAPYLAPVPYRSTKNEPSYLYEVAKKISEIKKIDISDVIDKTYNNAKKIFNI